MDSGPSIELSLRAALIAKGLLGAIGTQCPEVWKFTAQRAAKELKELFELADKEHKKLK